MRRRSAIAACFLLAFVTCKKSDPAEAQAKSELRDVRKACEHRAEWAHRIRKVCTRCIALSAAPACNCPADREVYSGRCASEQQARIDETACEPTYNCTYKCPSNDCACIEACYNGQERCHKLASAVDGCVAEVCDPYCR